MTEHPNAIVLRASQEAAASGDLEAAAAMVADDVVWHEIGNPDPVRGKAALIERMTGADYEIEGTIHDVLANDEHGVVLFEATARRGGRTLTYRTAEVFHLRDGRITERWAFSDDTATIVDFFA